MVNRMTVLEGFGLLWLRILMGAGIAHHGFDKIFGGHMQEFAAGVSKMGFPLPVVFTWLAAGSEFGGGILIAVGFVAGLIIASIAGRALTRYLFEIQAVDLTTFAGAGALLIAAAALACFAPARRATRVDPMTALRYE